MSFVVVIGVFALFFVGLVAVYQGFIGRDVNPEGQPFAMPLDRDHPGMTHPAERHPVQPDANWCWDDGARRGFLASL